MALSQDGYFCWTYSSISLSPNVIGTQNYIPCNLGAGFGGRLISHGFVVEFHFSSSTSIEDDLAYCILNLGSFFSCSIFFKNTIARVSSRLLIVCLMATWFRARLLFAQLCSTTHLLGSNLLLWDIVDCWPDGQLVNPGWPWTLTTEPWLYLNKLGVRNWGSGTCQLTINVRIIANAFWQRVCCQLID